MVVQDTKEEIRGQDSMQENSTYYRTGIVKSKIWKEEDKAEQDKTAVKDRAGWDGLGQKYRTWHDRTGNVGQNTRGYAMKM